VSPSDLRVGQRIRARVRREVPLWGLTAPAVVQRDNGATHIECEEPQDELRVRGFADAAVHMPGLDLARRTWSGRLSELFGERTVGSHRAPELDVFVRTLGFRRHAELAWRKADQAPLEQYAAGINGWIDGGTWERAPFWSQRDTRPRLWAPSDTLLLAMAPAQVDTSMGLLLVDDAAKSGWPEPWDRRLRALWTALSERALRAPGGVAGPVEVWAPGEVPKRATPTVLSVDILQGADNNRVRFGDGFRRLRARRHDLMVRGADVVRPWIRSSREGAVVSDLLAGATDALPPFGAGFVLRWPIVDGVAGVQGREPLDVAVVPRAAEELPRVRLVPLVRGA
jgi:acyl-homoserine lactone acylase PvdQ